MPESVVTVTVTYTNLESPADMVEALEQALPRGWYGTVTGMQPEPDAAQMWALVLNTPTNTGSVTARLGDVLLWDGATYQSFDQATFADRFQSGS